MGQFANYSNMGFKICQMVVFLDGKIARYKLPRKFEFLEELPLTETGKVKKIDLKRREADNQT